ncbi:F-box/kelch-repeat protein [Ananas comosus]|uniref:F-box/kelch-repeat protein n=1 Tax=Ananas comosus TaxID=4615 RepID=A0A199UH38_ANACO|nr:F-box/kelch-repeat protein [Ananas comosus]
MVGTGEEEERVLIPGLPDDVALDCLARVPLRYHGGLRRVCRRWRELAESPAFYRRRDRIGAAEDLVFLVQTLVAPDAREGKGKATEEEGEGEGEGRRRAGGGGHRRGGGGGWDPATLEPVAEVRVLDPAAGTWRRGAPMGAARSFFACAGAGARVYAAGGHDRQKNALRAAEAYDVAADEWAAVAAMGEERDECQGAAAAGGRFWAVSGYGTERQGRFDAGAEWYDEGAGEWTKEEGMWDPAAASAAADAEDGSGGAAAACCVGVAGRVWSVECGRRGVREYEGRGKGWRAVAPAPEGMRSSPRAAALGGDGGGERVFVMGAAEEGGGHRAWVLHVATAKWTRVETPPGFSGFAYSAAALRL